MPADIGLPTGIRLRGICNQRRWQWSSRKPAEDLHPRTTDNHQRDSKDGRSSETRPTAVKTVPTAENGVTLLPRLRPWSRWTLLESSHSASSP